MKLALALLGCPPDSRHAAAVSILVVWTFVLESIAFALLAIGTTRFSRREPD